MVCSLPFPVLRQVALDPPLSGLQGEAVRELPSQPVTQLHFGVRSPFWEADGLAPSLYTDGPAGMFAAARPDSASAEVTGFTAWVMGERARHLDGLPAPEAAALVIREIESVRPAARNQLEFIGRKSWGADPFAGGAWATFRPGQVTRFAAAMRVAHGRVHFCGEHLAHSEPGHGGGDGVRRARGAGGLGVRLGAPVFTPASRPTAAKLPAPSRPIAGTPIEDREAGYARALVAVPFPLARVPCGERKPGSFARCAGDAGRRPALLALPAASSSGGPSFRGNGAP